MMAKPTTRSFSSARKASTPPLLIPFKPTRYLWSVNGLAIVRAIQVEDLCELLNLCSRRGSQPADFDAAAGCRRLVSFVRHAVYGERPDTWTVALQDRGPSPARAFGNVTRGREAIWA